MTLGAVMEWFPLEEGPVSILQGRSGMGFHTEYEINEECTDVVGLLGV